tara:strand:+ start:6517 stop:7707 length:1191 start_codon:yes stop_codon:yes gene_type:complete
MNVPLLIDCKKYLKKNLHSKLLQKCKELPKTKRNSQLGLILIIPETIYQELDQHKEKINFIDTDYFVEQIKSCTYILFQKSKKICEILLPSEYNIQYILPCILKEFGSNTKIIVSIPFKKRNTIETFVQLNFGHPHICNKSIYSTKNYPIKTICLIYDGSKASMDEVNYLIRNERSDNYCVLKAQFSERTVDYFKKLPITGGFKEEKQHEIAGNMSAKLKGDIHIIDYNEDTIKRGQETGVDIVEGAFNYHSHPKQAYEKYEVKYAWPSMQDYIGFLLAIIEDDTIFHVVVTQEGLYIISLTKYWAINRDKLTKSSTGDHIEKNYKKSLKSQGTPYDYIKWVHEIDYQGHGPLFLVQYLETKKISSIFLLPYTKIGDNCFTCQKSKELYKKYYINK